MALGLTGGGGGWVKPLEELKIAKDFVDTAGQLTASSRIGSLA